jgi:diacylglycerol kinase (ATP)
MEKRSLKALFVINPNSGPLHRRKRVSEAIKLVSAYFPKLEIAFTEKKGDAFEFTEKGVQRGIELVWCAGGDGTINEVVNALYGTQIPLGIIPTGTGNGLAREIGISLNPLKAIEQLLQGEVISVFPGILNDKLFLLVSGAGYDAFIARETDRNHSKLKKLSGFLSYMIIGFLKGWKYPFPVISARIDGKTCSCYGLLVMKASGKIGFMTLAPLISLRDEKIGVFLFKKKGILNIFFFFITFLFSLHQNRPSHPFILCKEISASSKEPCPVQCDGENMPPLPAFWKVSEKQIRLIYPKGKR